MIYTLPSQPQPEPPFKAEKAHLETAHKLKRNPRNSRLNQLWHLLFGNQR